MKNTKNKMNHDLKYSIFEKFFSPKSYVINKPGVIINKLSRRYSSKSIRKRIVYYFEDIITNLQIETINKIGEKETRELWYKIGKDSGFRYVSASETKAINPNVLPMVIKNIFFNLKSAGMSSYENINFDHKNKILKLSGEDNIVSRKTGISETFHGIASGILSGLTRNNIECSESDDGKSIICKIQQSKNDPPRYILDTKKLKPIKNYNKLNFNNKVEIGKEKSSYSDLIKFKKINFDKSGKIYFLENCISPAAPEFLGIIIKQYLDINKKDILENGISNGSRKLAKQILLDKKEIKDKIKSFESLLSALGYGIPSIKKEKLEIKVSLANYPIDKNHELYYAYFIKGFLENIYDKKLKVIKLEENIKSNPMKMIIIYS